MATEIRECRVDEQRRRRIREENLATVRQGCDTRTAMDVDADVALRRDDGRSRVESHANADWLAGERGLSLPRRLGRSRGRRKGDKKGVALRIDLHASGRDERAA